MSTETTGTDRLMNAAMYDQTFDFGAWHPPLIVPAYLEDDDVCSECGRPFVDLRSCEKCKVSEITTWRLEPQSSSHTDDVLQSYNVLDSSGNVVLEAIALFPTEVSSFARMIECRNLIDGPEPSPEMRSYEDIALDNDLSKAYDEAIDRAATRVIQWMVVEREGLLRCKELMEKVRAMLRDELLGQ